MFLLKNKVIILISPQPWSNMYVSKHNYAIELAKRGNKVYFLNPVINGRKLSIQITPHSDISNLFLITFYSIVPYWLKFHIKYILDIFINIQISRILKRINQKVDIIWDFDCGNLYEDYRIFQSHLKIFHPVDQSSQVLPKHKKPDFIFSVSHDILNNYQYYPAPKKFINHGLSQTFLSLVEQNLIHENKEYNSHNPIKAAYIGNLLIPFINHSIILKAIKEFPEVQFVFFGTYFIKGNSNNIQYSPFVSALMECPNVVLHGQQTQDSIVKHIKDIDFFFFYYNEHSAYNRDNSHKILEYLSTGKVIIGSPLSVYKKSDLFIQADTPSEWLEAFRDILKHINRYNSPKRQRERLVYAQSQSYKLQVDRIEQYISNQYPY